MDDWSQIDQQKNANQTLLDKKNWTMRLCHYVKLGINHELIDSILLCLFKILFQVVRAGTWQRQNQVHKTT